MDEKLKERNGREISMPVWVKSFDRGKEGKAKGEGRKENRDGKKEETT